MADYNKKPTGNVRTKPKPDYLLDTRNTPVHPQSSAQQQHERFTKNVSPETRRLTTGMGDQQLGQIESTELKQKYSKRPVLNSKQQLKTGLMPRFTGIVNKMMGRWGTPVTNLLFDSTELNREEDYLLGAWKEQDKLSREAREKLVGTPRFESNLLNERIQDENAKQSIMGFSTNDDTFHVDYYDVLFGEDGLMFKNPDELTEEETQYGLGYTRSVEHLFNIHATAETTARKLIEHNKKFVTWWAYGGESQVTDSVIINNVEKKFPKLVTHGTFGDVFPSIGFWSRNMLTDPYVIQGLRKADDEQEMPSHLGTPYQATGAIADKRKDDKGKEFHTIRDNPSAIQSTIIDKQKGDDPRGTGPKYYSGWIKSNSLLKLPELHNWEFDVVLEHLQGGTMEKDGKIVAFGGTDERGRKFFKGKWTYAKPDVLSVKREIKLGADVKENPDLPEWKNKGTEFPKLMLYIGKGTAAEQVMNHAHKMMEEDYERVGQEVPNWNADFEPLSSGEKAEIHYYKMHGLMKFISEDLGYDGIEYDNEVEDVLNKGGEVKTKEERDPSYILFHPWQFKSIYNNGDYKRGRRNFLGSTSKYKKKEQVA